MSPSSATVIGRNTAPRAPIILKESSARLIFAAIADYRDLIETAFPAVVEK